LAGKANIRNPIRGAFVDCCASAMTAIASSTTTTNRVDKILAFLIARQFDAARRLVGRRIQFNYSLNVALSGARQRVRVKRGVR
jgi:hypothetical protein